MKKRIKKISHRARRTRTRNSSKHSKTRTATKLRTTRRPALKTVVAEKKAIRLNAAGIEPRPLHLHSLTNDVVLGYQRQRIGAALPWDHERHAVRTSWAKLSGDIGPREQGRGIRSGF